MATHPQSPVRLAFGPFEVNSPAGELLKSGVRVRLSGQPFRILVVLLAYPGEVVTREQLHEQIWSAGTFVDFEHSLNAAMNKLRQALGDSAEKPRYIETVPGRGYRFIGAVEHRLSPHVAPATGAAPILTTKTPVARRHVLSPVKAWMALAAAATAFGIWGVVMPLTTKPVSIPGKVLQFVIVPPSGTIFAPPISRQSFAISPDGKRLAFTATGPNGTQIWMRDLAALNMWPVPGTEGAWAVFWSLDSRSILYSVKRTLKQANLETGSTRSLASLPIMAMYGAWRSKGDLLLYLGVHNFYEFLEENGSLRELPGASMRWLQFLPRADRFIHVVFDPALGRYRALATDYVSHKSTPLMETDSRVQYAPPRRPRISAVYSRFESGGLTL